jgi:hypothetical protein
VVLSALDSLVVLIVYGVDLVVVLTAQRNQFVQPLLSTDMLVAAMV